MNLFEIEIKSLLHLQPLRAVQIFRRLLWAEADRVGIGRDLITVPECIDVGDGGIDSYIDNAGHADESLIPKGNSGYQIKAGSLSSEQCADELLAGKKPKKNTKMKKGKSKSKNKQTRDTRVLKPEIKKLLDRDGTYVLVLFAGITDAKRAERVKRIKDVFKKKGYPKAKVRVYVAEQLAGSIERLPGMVSFLDKDLLACQSFDSWSGDADIKFPSKYFSDKQRTDAIVEIRDNLRNNRSKANIFLVGGLPGIGKTRFVHELLNQPDLRATVIYVDARQFIDTPLFNKLLDDAEKFAIVVFDECDTDTFDKICKKISSRFPRLAAVCISNEIRDVSSPDIKHSKLDALSKDQIEAIIRFEAPALAPQVVDRLATFADGYPRIAEILAKSFAQSKDDTNSILLLKDISLLNRLIAGRLDPASSDFLTHKAVLGALSLFAKIGFLSPADNEARWLAGFIGIDWRTFSDVVRFQQERQIIKGKTYIYVTPFMLKIHLYVDWWKSRGFDKEEFDQFVQTMPDIIRTDLAKRFFDHIPFVTSTPHGLEFTKSLLGPDGMFDNGEFLNTEVGSQFFLKLTEADPESALALLQRTVETWSLDKLKLFDEGRRNIVWALERILVWDHLFEPAAKILLRLAQAENETWANNATGIFKSLFNAYAPTTATFDQRYELLEQLVHIEDENALSIVADAMSAALNIRAVSISLGAERQGLRPNLEFWHPKTYNELYLCVGKIWQLSVDSTRSMSEPNARRLATALLSNARSIMEIPGLSEMVIRSLSDLNERQLVSTNDLLRRIVEMIHYDAKRMTPQLVSQLVGWRDRLTGESFSSRMNRFVRMQIIEDEYNAEGERINIGDAKREELAKEAMADPESLKRELPWLCTNEAFNAFSFGRELGLLDPSAKHLPDILEATSGAGENRSVLFLSGYLSELEPANRNRHKEILDNLAEDPNLQRYVPEISWRTGASDVDFLRVTKLFSDGKVGIEQLQILPYGRVVEGISEKVFTDFLSALLAKGTLQSVALGIDLIDSYYLRTDAPKDIPLAVIESFLTHQSLISDKNLQHTSQMLDYHYVRIAKYVLSKDSSRGMSIAAFIFEHFGTKGSMFESHFLSINEYMNEVVKLKPVECWKIIQQYLDPPFDDRSFQLRQWLRGEDDFNGMFVEGSLSLIPPDHVWKWVGDKPKQRAWLIGGFVPRMLSNAKDKHCYARELLVRYGESREVRSSLYANFGTEGWVGPESDHLRSKIAYLSEYRKSDSNRKVRKWIDDYVMGLEKRLKQTEAEEERREY